MLRGIDFMLSENANKDSPLYGKIDTKMIGAFGHSPGSMATAKAGALRAKRPLRTRIKCC